MADMHDDPRSKTADELILHNVATIRELHEQAYSGTPSDHRLIARLTQAIARPRTLYLVLILVALWVIVNSILPKPWDAPPYPWLEALISFSSFVTTIMVLTVQRQQARISQQRADLELQVNLLAEHKVAKLIALVEELRRDMPGVPNRVDNVAETMQQPASAQDVIEAVENKPPE